MTRFKEEENPYTLQFSFIPPKFIERRNDTDAIISNYVRPVPTYRGMFITGVRGSGKTVLLSDIRNRIGAMKDWIAVDINPETNLTHTLVSKLYRISKLRTLFIKAKLDFSVMGFGASIENAEAVAYNDDDVLEIMLETLKKKGIKLLVTIDEIMYSSDVAKFSHALSSYAGEDYYIYVLMTGLKENIDKIKNQPSLTFLYRAKVMEIDSLNTTAISAEYQKTLALKVEEADRLAFDCRGYSLA
ncbi:MAG: ATP-binding protein, partial [Lachnospiraceae bacterium]|nr:ATP-binding protein [Lachnospiraceae bacterium]